MTQTADNMVSQRGKDAPNDKFDDKVIQQFRRPQEALRGRKGESQQPQQDTDSNKGDNAGDAVKNGCYRSNGKLDRLQIQINRSLFFTNMPTQLLLLYLPPT